MTTHVTTRNPVRADLPPSGTPTPTTRRTSNGWALAGVAAGVLGIGTMVSSSTIMVFGAALAARVASYFATARPPVTERDEPFPDLTDRERDVLELLASGSSNDAIARALYVSDKTVRNTVSSIYTKLHAAGRGEAIVKAREAGYGRGER